MDDFMRRPTETMVSFMATVSGVPEERMRRVLQLGRIAMAMELMTVVQIIDEYSLLPSKQDTISVIQTLIVDQDLLEDADEWYKRLSEWRRIKLDLDENGSVRDAVYEDPDVQPSGDVTPRGALPPPDSNGARHGTDRKTDPPSAS